MAIHAMIDLETLHTTPQATVLTVGGVKFSPHNSVEPSQGMYFRVDVDSQTAMGRDVMQETLFSKGKQTITDKQIQKDREEEISELSDSSVKEFMKHCNI